MEDGDGVRYSYFDRRTLKTVLLTKPTDDENMVFLVIIGSVTNKES